MSGTRSDVVEEALRTAEEAEQEDLALRLLGGVAIRLRAKDGLHPAFEREYADLDWIVPKGKSSDAQKFFDSIGYTPHVRFNAIHGQERLLFFDEQNDRQVDVLVGSFRMCHEIPFGKRLDPRARHGPAGGAAAHQAPDHRAQREGRPRRPRAAARPPGRGERRRGGKRRPASPGCAPLTGACGAPSPPTSRSSDEHIGRYDLPEESKRAHRRARPEVAGAHRRGAQDIRLEDAGQDRRPQAMVRAARRGGGRT